MRHAVFLTLLIANIGAYAGDRSECIVHFASDVSVLDAQSLDMLKAFIVSLDRSVDHSFTVQGHTDHEGPGAYNDSLASERARHVCEVLVGNGVDPKLIVTEAFGERAPLRNERTEEDMALDRRVLVIFERHTFTSLDELFGLLTAGTVQEFSIDPSREQTLTGAHGSVVSLPANALVDAHGRPVSGQATVRITEALDMDAMLGHALNTRAGDRLLETSGMMKVEAFDTTDNALALAPGTAMVVSVPRMKQASDMKWFTSTTGSDWTLGGAVETASIAPLLEVPSEPVYRIPNFRMPVYKPAKDAPHAPVPPVRPKLPVPPDKARFDRRPKWYEFLFAGRVRETNAKRYAAAERAYAHAMDVYNERWKRCESEEANLEARRVEWRERWDKWNAREVEAKKKWEREVYAPAQRELQRMTDALNIGYDSLLTAYKEKVKVYSVAYQEDMRSRVLREQQEAAARANWLQRVESGGEADNNDAELYVMRVNTLGWINCDRFYDTPSNMKYDAFVRDDDGGQENVYLVFTQIHSLVRMVRENDGYAYNGVPRDQPATVLAVKVVNNHVLLSRKTMSPTVVCAPEYKESSFLELRRVLQELSAGWS